MEPGLIIAGAAGVAGLGIGLGTAVRLIPVYVGARGELKEFNSSSRAAVYYEIEMLERERRYGLLASGEEGFSDAGRVGGTRDRVHECVCSHLK